MSGLDWKSTRKTPGRLAKKARPNLSDSALNDPGYEDRAKWRDVLNIASGLPGAEIAMAKGLTGLGALAGVVKPKGGNWLSGSVEDALRGLKRQGATTRDEALAILGDPRLADSPDVMSAMGQRNSLNSWIEGPLTKYVKTRMASPDDEVRKLAEQGVLHFEPAMIRERSPLTEKIVSRRETAGFPIQGIADAPLARNWENTSDSIIRNLEARDLSSAERAASFGGKSNIPGDTIVHEMNPFASGAGISDLGFPHLIDELSNALNPASGLPRNLQLSPEAMKQMSMEKAVRRVAEINAWRAAQKVEANRKLAEQASLVRGYEHPREALTKQFMEQGMDSSSARVAAELELSNNAGKFAAQRALAENNPKGLRWVELKDPGVPTEFDVSRFVVQDGPRGGRGVFDTKQNSWFVPPTTGMDDEALLKHALDSSTKDGRRQALADQLKYEGDTMGHCVGGYCDDVLSGRSRIFSLRDAKGEPHVTVEVAPDVEDFERGVARRELLPEEFAKRYPNELGTRIVQIKGKQNKAPNEEYLPFVQDFVRNNPLGGQWSDVGDLGNTGLLRNKLHPSGFINRSELEAAAKNPPEGFAPEDFVWPERYAQGGSVQSSLPAEPASGYNSWQSLFGEVA